MSITCLITGASGLLGRSFVTQLSKQYSVIACFKTHVVNFDRSGCTSVAVDLEDECSVRALVGKVQPCLMIHCAGLTNVDGCEKDPDLAFRLNATSTRILAQLSKVLNSQFVYISTDHLYDGKKSFYCETDVLNPLNVYAYTKWQGELAALEENPQALIIRTNFFGKGMEWRQSLTDWIWGRLKEGLQIPAFLDSYFTPIAIPELVQIVIDLINHNASGVYNVCGSERLSKYEFALKFADYFGFSHDLIEPVKMQEKNLGAKRPPDMSLSVDKVTQLLGQPMPNIEQSFAAIKREYQL